MSTELQRPRRKVVRASGIERRQKIIEGTLRVIIREGIRAVRHRAVAKEAGVPLAATTYYFQDLHELLAETFRYWSQQASNVSEAFRIEVFNVVEAGREALTSGPEARLQLADRIAAIASSYTLDQVENRRQDRIIELAFHHEAMRNDALRTLVSAEHRKQLDSLELFHRYLGSTHPEADAHITLSLMHQLEQQAMMQGEQFKTDIVHQVYQRHLREVLDVSG